MVKFTIDTGKLLKDKKKLLGILKNYNLVIFDLDNTIFPLYFYDKIIFKNLVKKINRNKNINNKDIVEFLILKKHFNNSKKKIFNELLRNFDFKNKISEQYLVRFYQNYHFINNFNPPSLKSLLIKLKNKNKKLVLITEGNKKRQKNKIKSLGINKIFNYKIILDGKKKNNLKPSIIGLKKYLHIIRKNNSIYLGDNLKDELLSKKLNVKFYNFDISKIIKKKIILCF